MAVRQPLLVSIIGVWVFAFAVGCVARRHSAQIGDAEPGKIQFQSYCAACHQSDGQGMGDAPPLAGSSWVTGPEQRLIKIVLHGVRGRMEVAGKSYDREMPGFGAVLNDGDVAALLSFVRARFGGAGLPITAESVARIRAAHSGRTDYWPVEELLREP